MSVIKLALKVWGEEHWIVNIDYCGKLLKLKKMHRCSIHHHKKKTETFYIVKGQVLLELQDNAYMMLPGDAIDILPGQDHRFTGMVDSEIMEFSTHHEDEDSYRTVCSGKVEKYHLPELNEKIALAKNNNDVIRKVENGKEEDRS